MIADDEAAAAASVDIVETRLTDGCDGVASRRKQRAIMMRNGCETAKQMSHDATTPSMETSECDAATTNTQ